MECKGEGIDTDIGRRERNAKKNIQSDSQEFNVCPLDITVTFYFS